MQEPVVMYLCSEVRVECAEALEPGRSSLWLVEGAGVAWGWTQLPCGVGPGEH